MSSTSCCIEVAASSEQLCYIPCNFCNIVLAVSVPCSSLSDIVTVRCGHCTNLWSVNMNMVSVHQSLTNPTSQTSSSSHRHGDQDPNQNPSNSEVGLCSSTRYMPVKLPPPPNTNDQSIINAPPEKRTRVPSAYNQFIKQEIQRIKATNSNISHREAFSAAAKNWAHLPHIHVGLMLEGNNHQPKLDQLSYMQGSKKRLKSTKESIDK
ncbi:unnamed protein product [Lactuca saligna]|uniref:Uncharacterized protein n=1 Tax=Lactuca saligna TaxID=75948 RepID=A0AA36EJK8_LACSI|nr:unnamed protein product [Lactuca saligna]